MYKQLKNKTDGFTIIEVLIVLAIAGLIMVIVFLAVPALQRNNRNTGRDADAQRITSAANECIANNNGLTTNCADVTALDGTYIELSENQYLMNDGMALDGATLAYSTECDASGTGTQPAEPRSFTITYLVETSGGTETQCIGG